MIGELFAANPFFQGGMSLMLVGGALATLRSVPGRLWTITKSKLYVECVVDNEDSLHYWLALWLADRPEIQRSGVLRVVSHWDESQPGEAQQRNTLLGPGDGEHIITYRGVKFWFTSSTSEPGGMSGTQRIRSLRVRCLKRNRTVLEQLLKEVTERERRPDPTKIKVFLPDGQNWSLHRRRPIRTEDSVVLDGDDFATLVKDMREFGAAAERYESLCIPWRRGYLFYGPPGNGKSSLALAAASATGRDLYVLPLGDQGMNDEKLLRLLINIPAKSLVVIEDIDTVFNGRSREAENKLTMSGLLNAIDGPVATEGRIVVMTTNHREVLDPALVRPGRTDVHLELRNASVNQASRLFNRFFPDQPAVTFAEWAGNGTHSMAALQAHLVENMNDWQAASRAPEVLND